MENIYLSANVVLPMCIYMVVGFLVRRLKIMDERALAQANALSYKVFMPIMLFQNLYSSDIQNSFSPRLILICIATLAVLVALVALAMRRLPAGTPRKAAIMQCVVKSNFVIYGTAVCEKLYGSDGLTALAVFAMVMSPLVNAVTITILEGSRGRRAKPLHLLGAIFKNPMIVGTLLGVVCLLLKLRLPAAVEYAFSKISGATTCLCFIVLGGSLMLEDLRANRGTILTVTLVKLVAVPALSLPVAVLLGLRGVDLVCFMMLFATPSGVANYAMAQEMGADSKLAGQLVAVTALVSLFTVFCLIVLLKNLALI